MCKSRFFICKHCGNQIGMIHCSGASVVCCGDKMTELVPGSVDASHEKHVPVVTVSGDTVTVEVGSAAHPMVDEHYIEWIYLETKSGGQRKALKPGDAPKAVFKLIDDEAVTAFAYCNLHGLWKKDV
jgi:superoxide reductase